jgi:hypothetical protein
MQKAIPKALITILAVFFIWSCNLTPPIAYTGLIITEVGSTYFSTSIGAPSPWIEVTNTTASVLNLSWFQLRAYGVLRVSPYTVSSPQAFSLPSLVIQPGAYALVRGKGTDNLVNGGRVAYVLNSPDTIPYWTDQGFVELISGGQTSDFVSFGGQNAVPLTSGWDPGDAPALPNASNQYGYSLARDGGNTDTGTAADWALRSFATPGGPNDVTSNTDDDADGIPDCSEAFGSTFAGLDLYGWGARTGQKDIFIHIDYMQSTDPGITPREEALDKMAAVFLTKGYYIHFDVGDLYASSKYNLDGTSHMVPYNQAVWLGVYGNAANLYEYKNKYMELAKRQIFHYALFANSQLTSGLSGSSGVAEINGNDLIITLGAWGLNASTTENQNKLINYQASTLMHEFGHNLGLWHGGDVYTNYMPNYYSIMNYMYQLHGLPEIGNTMEGDRYYYYQNVVIKNALFDKYGISSQSAEHNNCYTTNFVMDYSNGNGGSLDENAVDEPDGLQRSGSAGIDFNGDGIIEIPGEKFNLNPDQDARWDVFNDYNDWAHLNLFFTRYWYGDTTGARSLATLELFPDPVGDDRQEVVAETLTRPDR